MWNFSWYNSDSLVEEDQKGYKINFVSVAVDDDVAVAADVYLLNYETIIPLIFNLFYLYLIRLAYFLYKSFLILLKLKLFIYLQLFHLK